MHVILHGMRVVKTEKMLFSKQIWISVLLDNVTSKPLKHKQNTPLFLAKQTYSVQGSSNLDVPCKEFLLTSLSRLIQISMQSFITMLLLWSFKFQLWQVVFSSEEFLCSNYALNFNRDSPGIVHHINIWKEKKERKMNSRSNLCFVLV